MNRACRSSFTACEARSFAMLRYIAAALGRAVRSSRHR